MAVDFELWMSASMTRKKFLMVCGCMIKGHQDVGMFVHAGSSSVSFKRIAEKSKAKHFSRIDKVSNKLSHRT